MPSVTVQNARFRAKPRSVARSGVSFKESNGPRGGLGKKGNRQRQQEARSGGNIKWKPPTEIGPQSAAEQISSRRPDGYRQIENAKDASALILRKQVSDKGGGDGDEGRLANPHQRMPYQQLPVGVGKCGEQREPAPENRTEHDNSFA